MLSLTMYNLCNILLYTTNSRGSRPVKQRAHLLHQFVQFLRVASSDAATDGCKENCTYHNRLVEDMQYFAACSEGPKLPKEV